METNDFDLIIIGGGAAGMMSAISARRHHKDFKIAILERTFAMGRKILVAGAGRCNITNVNLDTEVEKRYYGAKKEFVKSIFDQFGYKDIINFFADLGIETYVERKTSIGKVFPVTDQAHTVTALLDDEISLSGIEIFLNTECKTLVKNGETFELEAEFFDMKTKEKREYKFKSRYIIMSAGGKAYPSYGSNGTGYTLVESLGHKIIEPVPSALSLEGKTPLSQLLQRTKLDMEAISIIDGKEIKRSTDDVMFKEYGISGPAILNISREISIHINREHKDNALVVLNFFPGKTRDEVAEFLKARWAKRPEQIIEHSLYGLFPNKVSTALLEILNIDKNIKLKNLTQEQISKILDLLTGYQVKITGTRGWNECEFTAGGVDTDDIKEGTLESKLVDNLYFAGEICDVDGDVGGFNLSWAWSSGHVAGKLG